MSSFALPFLPTMYRNQMSFLAAEAKPTLFGSAKTARFVFVVDRVVVGYGFDHNLAWTLCFHQGGAQGLCSERHTQEAEDHRTRLQRSRVCRIQARRTQQETERILTVTNNQQGEWKATGIDSNTKFDAIDLTEGDWYDYDEKASEEVSIKDLNWEIKRA